MLSIDDFFKVDDWRVENGHAEAKINFSVKAYCYTDWVRSADEGSRTKFIKVCFENCADLKHLESEKKDQFSKLMHDWIQRLTPPKVIFLKGVKLASVHCALQEYLASPFSGDLCELAMATVVNAHRENESAIWPMIVSVPSDAKTETVSGVIHEPTVYYLDNLTDHSFISGFVDKDGKSPPDLLSELDRKCLLVKDLSPLLSAKADVAKAIIGQLVSIYDGRYAAKFGTKGKVEYKFRFSFLSCVTPKAIAGHYRYMQALGGRLLFYRPLGLTEEQEDEGMNVILANEPEELSRKKKHYQLVCSSYVHDLVSREQPNVRFDPKWNEKLKAMARLLARARAVSMPSEEDYPLTIKDFQIERPFRILTQLKALANSLAVVHGRDEVTGHEMELVRRVVLFSIPQNRYSLLELFQDRTHLNEGGMLTVNGAVSAAINLRNAHKLLNELSVLQVLNRDSSNKEHTWTPLPEFKDLLATPILPIDHIADSLIQADPILENVKDQPSCNKLTLGETTCITEGSELESTVTP